MQIDFRGKFRFGVVIIGVPVVCISLLATVIFVQTLSVSRDAETTLAADYQTYLRFTDETVAIMDALANVNRLAGFSGFVQRFNHYLLTADREQGLAALASLVRLQAGIGDLNVLASTLGQHEAVRDIRDLLGAYEQVIDRALRSASYFEGVRSRPEGVGALEEELTGEILLLNKLFQEQIGRSRDLHDAHFLQLSGMLENVARSSWLMLGFAGLILVCGGVIVYGLWHLSRMSSTLSDALERAHLGERAKSDFLSVMSHEFRTPLNGVIGVADLMEGDAETEQQRQLAGLVRTSGKRLLGMIEQVMDYSELESGALHMASEPFQLVAVLRAAGDRARTISRNPAVAFSEQYDVPEQMERLGDAERIGRILDELLENAVKFTPAGRIGYSAVLRGDVLTVQVSDTGVGMSAEEVASAFDRFHQADASLGRHHEGLGLGLAVVRRLVAAMHGKVSVTSVPNEGSTFTLTIPLAPVRST